MSARRAMDLALAGAGLLALGPVIVTAMLCVWAAMGRPLIFRQRRVGRHGRGFWLYKLRTMTPDPTAAAGAFHAGDRSRVTPLGARLRALKLDELPQLVNVLRGDMALVGPRPEVRRWVEAYPEQWRAVLRVRPGITDPASLRFRNEEALLAASDDPEGLYRDVILPRKLRAYREYLERRTLASDLRVMLRTVRVLLAERGRR